MTARAAGAFPIVHVTVLGKIDKIVGKDDKWTLIDIKAIFSVLNPTTLFTSAPEYRNNSNVVRQSRTGRNGRENMCIFKFENLSKTPDCSTPPLNFSFLLPLHHKVSRLYVWHEHPAQRLPTYRKHPRAADLSGTKGPHLSESSTEKGGTKRPPTDSDIHREG